MSFFEIVDLTFSASLCAWMKNDPAISIINRVEILIINFFKDAKYRKNLRSVYLACKKVRFRCGPGQSYQT